MKIPIDTRSQTRGFALIVTLSLMILLTVIAVGLLTLSSISLRSTSAGDAEARANANARLAVILAIGELQRHAGDDRRITADASIFDTAAPAVPPVATPQAHLVGTWSSWSPSFAVAPGQSAPNYTTEKAGKFLSWLASSPNPADLKTKDWWKSNVTADWARLFSTKLDGYDLSAPKVPTSQGSVAWVISQENTKAKINVAGPEGLAAKKNAELHAQARPSLALATNLKDPGSEWNLRAGRVISLSQVKLDSAMTTTGPATPSVGASYTVHSQGLLTDVVKGGLKTDLSLGFEMADPDFASDSWGATKNPFRSPNSTAGFSAPASYENQQPLFSPTVVNPVVSMKLNFDVATVSYRFIAAGVPTFDHLRSFYRIPHHLYGTSISPTVAERGADHAAIQLPTTPPGGTYFSPAYPPNGATSKTSIRPVLNRMIYLLSTGIGPDKKLRLIITPVVSLWNPYNTALEINGAVVYPWADMPFKVKARTKKGTTVTQIVDANVSLLMGKQFMSKGHGRSVNPYFFCEISSGGSGTTTTPIRFEPGQVRLFTPLDSGTKPFISSSNNMARTVKLREVDGGPTLNRKGGFSIPMGGDSVPSGATVQTEVEALNNEYPYFVSMEDSFRVGKNPSKDDAPGGEPITEVQMVKMVSETPKVLSAYINEKELSENSPFGVIETYQRVAKKGVVSQSVSDLMYTTNPRQPSMNKELALGSFTAPPHYQSSLRGVATFDDAILTNEKGEAYWGASHTADGSSRMPFFEIPREPMLSLAGFQHTDLASTTFSAANQFANSWASAYLSRNVTTKTSSNNVPIYDHSYLGNEALWDGYFFSGVAPEISPAANGNPSTAWANPIAKVNRPLKTVIEDFIQNPQTNKLSNTRMRMNKRGMSDETILDRLTEPAGCTRIASHLMVDGAFNVNSTDVEAWISVLSGLRGKTFDVEGVSSSSQNATAFPRFRHPTGTEGDNWNGFRTLNDTQLRDFAKNIVEQVKLRGPFLSLAEFVNRRVENTDLGNSGALQSAIDKAALNVTSKQAPFTDLKIYPKEAKDHIINDTGVGIPGYLTQADVLQSLAPVITARSDTFTIRCYGEAKDKSGKVIARAWCEAVVQRNQEFVDPSTPAESPIAAVSPINQTFGRRFDVVSFRRVSPSEFQ